MPKMKTLMPDDEAPDRDPRRDGGGRGGRGPPGVPVPEHDLLRELARPCEETVVRTDTTAAYVGFASSRSATWDSLRQLHPKIQEGTPFVGMSDGQFELADPLKFHLARFKQFWSVRDDQYHIERVEFTDPGRHSGLKEEFLAVTVVHLGRRPRADRELLRRAPRRGRFARPPTRSGWPARRTGRGWARPTPPAPTSRCRSADSSPR